VLPVQRETIVQEDWSRVAGEFRIVDANEYWQLYERTAK